MKTPQYVSHSMYLVLSHLVHISSGTDNLVGIARGVKISPSAVSPTLKRLMELGFVRKVERRGNAVYYEITLKGKLLYDLLTKKDMDEEELLRYWVRNVIRPRLGEMMSVSAAAKEVT